MSVEIVDGSFRVRLELLLGSTLDRTWLAAPFLTSPVAEWLAARPATLHGDRRLLVSWDPGSIQSLYLSAHGVALLQSCGFQVRDLRNLHAKTIIAGRHAYVGSGNLTTFGLFGRNTEIGVFIGGSGAASAAELFDGWWNRGRQLTTQEIEQAKALQDALPTRASHERQPGDQRMLQSPTAPRYWIKSQYYRPVGLRIKPGQQHWISDPGSRDAEGRRLLRKDGEPFGKPSYRVGDCVGIYLATTLKVPTMSR